MQGLADDEAVLLRLVVALALRFAGLGHLHRRVHHGFHDLALGFVGLAVAQAAIARQQTGLHRLLTQQLGVGAFAQGLQAEGFVGLVQGDAVDTGHLRLRQSCAGAGVAAAAG